MTNNCRMDNTLEYNLLKNDIEIIKDIFSQIPAVKEVWIFGSRAKGNSKNGSDIDLAIMNEGVSDDDLLNLQSAFEESLLPYFVDVINFPELDHESLKHHILRVGKPIYYRTHI